VRWAEAEAGGHRDASCAAVEEGHALPKTRADQAAKRASEKLAQDSWGMDSGAAWGEEGSGGDWGQEGDEGDGATAPVPVPEPACCASAARQGLAEGASRVSALGDDAQGDWTLMAGGGAGNDWGGACEIGDQDAEGISSELERLQLKAQQKLEVGAGGAGKSKKASAKAKKSKSKALLAPLNAAASDFVPVLAGVFNMEVKSLYRGRESLSR
jgi:hypothetical protein